MRRAVVALLALTMVAGGGFGLGYLFGHRAATPRPRAAPSQELIRVVRPRRKMSLPITPRPPGLRTRFVSLGSRLRFRLPSEAAAGETVALSHAVHAAFQSGTFTLWSTPIPGVQVRGRPPMVAALSSVSRLYLAGIGREEDRRVRCNVRVADRPGQGSATVAETGREVPERRPLVRILEAADHHAVELAPERVRVTDVVSVTNRVV